MSPPYHLRRTLILWLPLFAVGAIFFAATIHVPGPLPLLGVFLAACVGAPGLILDRPHPSHA